MDVGDVGRRLAGILAADVVGYSAMVGADEPGTLARVRTLRSDIIEPQLAAHGGRLFKTTGDGFFVAFASAVQALRCAIAIQEALRSQTDGLQLRIGVHQGEVVPEGDDLLGDGVIVAARLEPLAEPGGVCISARVREDATGKIPFAVDDLGTPPLKNIAQPIRVFRVRVGALARPAAASPEKPSIAVLPFQNMSGDSEQEYFVDGIVEDLITGLSRVKWLYVMARNSSFTYKGRAVDVKQVGRELGVGYVLEGSLRKAGSRVRITAQLIETTTGAHVWAERYDSSLGDIFQLQDDITFSVVGAIEPSLQQAEIERAKRKRPENLDAYDLYLRARPHAHVAMPGDAGKALELLHRSLALQPDYAAAHAAAAWCYEQRYLRGGLHDDDRTAGLTHARAALEAGADDATTLATAGFVIGLIEHDYETAMNAIDRALALNSSSALALGLGSTILAHAGRTDRAIQYGERALRLSLHDPTIYLPLTALGIAHLAAGKHEEAALVCNTATQSNPRFSFPRVLQTAALSLLGRADDAKAAAQKVLELEPGFSIAMFVRSHTGRPDIWNPIGDALRRVGLPE